MKTIKEFLINKPITKINNHPNEKAYLTYDPNNYTGMEARKKLEYFGRYLKFLYNTSEKDDLYYTAETFIEYYYPLYIKCIEKTQTEIERIKGYYDSIKENIPKEASNVALHRWLNYYCPTGFIKFIYHCMLMDKFI